MKKISLAVTMAFLAAVLPIRAQDAALKEHVDKLDGYVKDLLAAQEVQQKRVDTLAKDLDALRDQISKPGNSASQEDVRKLAAQLQEIDQKREADKKLILKEIEDLGKTFSASRSKPQANMEPSTQGSGGSAQPNKGYEYTIQLGDTISAVAEAYRLQGIKVTSDQIIKANPGVDPTKLKAGQKIFIPAQQ